MKKSLREQVMLFHELSGVPVHHVPFVPQDERVRLRLMLVLEETLELLMACTPKVERQQVKTLLSNMQSSELPIEVDLVDVADALGDIDYVVEGTRLEFGIHGQAVADEIHAANLRKFPVCTVCMGGGRMPARTTPSKYGPMIDTPCGHCQGRGHLRTIRSDGKVLKPQGWQGPDIARVLREQGWKEC